MISGFRPAYKRLFLHFFDIHFLEEVGGSRKNDGVAWECRVATRLAVAAAERVFVPAASFVESDLCRATLTSLKELFPLGVLELVGGAGHLGEFRQERLNIYPENSLQHNAYLCLDTNEFVPPFHQKKSSTTGDIIDHWKNILETGISSQNLDAGLSLKLPKCFEESWAAVPEKLGEKAFVLDHVSVFLGAIAQQPIVRRRLHNIINAGYFRSYINDLNAGIVSDLIYLNPGGHIPTSEPDLPYRSLITSLRHAGILNHVANCSPHELLELNMNPVWQECLTEATEKGNTHEHVRKFYHMKRSELVKNKFFIVHGHDHKLLYELKDYLQNRLKFPEPTILMQQPDSGRTIIEKFEDCSSDVDGAMVLLTPDDLAEAKVGTIKRARQNVIFELGYFVAKFGRKSGRVLLLHSGETEIPSDLNGVIYIDVSGGIESAGEKIRKELGL